MRIIQVFIKDRKTFKTIHTDTADTWTIPISSAIDDTGNITIYDTDAEYVNNFLAVDGRVYVISAESPQNGINTLTISDISTIFERETVYPLDSYTTYGEFIEDVIKTEYINCDDPQYAISFLDVINFDYTEFEDPALDDTRLFVLKDIISAAEERGVEINYVLEGDRLKMYISTKTSAVHNIVFDDGVADISSETYTNDTISKITVLKKKATEQASDETDTEESTEEEKTYISTWWNRHRILQGYWCNNSIVYDPRVLCTSRRIPLNQGMLIRFIPKGLYIQAELYEDGETTEPLEVTEWLGGTEETVDIAFENAGYAVINFSTDSSGIQPFSYIYTNQDAELTYDTLDAIPTPSFSLNGGNIVVTIPDDYVGYSFKIGENGELAVDTSGSAYTSKIVYPEDFTAELYVLSEGTPVEYESFTYYLTTDGSVTDKIPENRVDGKWAYEIIEDADDPQSKAEELVAENIATHKIEFYSENIYSLWEKVNLKLANRILESYIVSITISSENERYLYRCGELKTTLSERLS